MEHRIDRRIPANLQVDIYFADRCVGTFPVSNIGASGLCLENCEGVLHSDNYLEVVVALPHRDSPMRWTINALVIWTSSSRAGLMWVEDNSGFSGLFRHLLKNVA